MLKELSKRIITSFIILIIFFFCYFINAYLFYSLTIVVSLISWIELKGIFKLIKFKKSLKNISIFLSLVYLSFFAFMVSYAYYKAILLIFVILVCIFSDIGGYVVGKSVGGKKLTKISPNKTISGSIGSFCFSLMPLFISYLKRKAKVKDTGNILPGHGGILDRIDGIILAVPVGILLLLR